MLSENPLTLSKDRSHKDRRVLRVLGTRGVPAAHGGFETFAEKLAIYLHSKGWRVIVYCQHEGTGPTTYDAWNDVERVNIVVPGSGPKSTVIFDWRATAHAAKQRDLCLTLGYNTAVFSALLRLKRVPNLINMDGIEWARAKWGWTAKAWFYLNERLGCWLGNHLIADHPGIRDHLQSRAPANKITVIPYGADLVLDASDAPVKDLGLEVNGYLTLIARPEPENSVLEVVRAFSGKRRGLKLVVLGTYRPTENSYHKRVLSAASDEVVFVGAIYESAIVQSLRYHSRAYIHGHQVGGTNPSLVEALGAGNPIIAHDNPFNRWVAGEGARYFTNEESCSALLDTVLVDTTTLERMRSRSRKRHEESFTWDHVLSDYEHLLERWLPD